mmetsp:Transcript_11488/g.17289  ORF Transcript_11488/g.17289 Transcript_11488/m.17289 type:complete len:97 (+) Transcript_11488:2499-2789(+)
MKIYLNKLNKRIDILVDAWKKAENMMSKMGDYKVLMEQAQKRKEALQQTENGGGSKGGDKKDDENLKKQKEDLVHLYSKQPITDFLRQEITKSSKQ